jgi:PAS domain S-box-containing protein
MWEWLSPDRFMPHGHCYLWTPGLVWLQVITNALIGSAYFVISAVLWYLVRRIEDVPFRWMYLCFGVFIVTCGMTHYFDVLTIWRPVYWIDGGVRAITAVASVGTALLLFPLIPKAIALGGAARVAHERGLQLEALNRELAVLYARTRETLAEAIPQLVWTSHPDGSPEYFNARWFDYLGEPSHADLSFDAVHPDDAEEFRSRLREAQRSGAIFETECRLRRRDGVYLWHLARALPLIEGGHIVKWFGTFTDIDERKRAADEREAALGAVRAALEEREVFLAVAGHELRTPLTPLRLQLDRLQSALAADVPLDREKLGSLQATARRQLDRLESLVDTVLDVSQGQFDLSRERVDLRVLLRRVASRFETEAERLGTELRLDLDDSPSSGSEAARPIEAVCDPRRIDQAVANLLGNALKFCEGKPVEIRLRATQVVAYLTIRDQGAGIAPGDMSRIFERFQRGVSARHYGGLGLGLWIVARVAEAHGGTVSVESVVGGGSAFTLELPLAPDAPADLPEDG